MFGFGQLLLSGMALLSGAQAFLQESDFGNFKLKQLQLDVHDDPYLPVALPWANAKMGFRGGAAVLAVLRWRRVLRCRFCVQRFCFRPSLLS
jgi:hypothetical protein